MGRDSGIRASQQRRPERAHAVLVAAHGDLTVLSALMEILDDEDIDFFVHVDARSRASDPASLAGSIRRSRLYLPARRQVVTWGASSQVEVTLRLLSAARQHGYRHYHLVSGADLPLVSAEQFKEFFKAHPDFEWVGVDLAEQDRFSERVRYYYPFQPWIGRGDRLYTRALRRVQIVLVGMQRALGVDRTARFQGGPGYGTSWFSISDHLASYILEHRDEVMRLVRWTVCGDEHFLQTLIQASPFQDRRSVHRQERSHSEQALRAIDWERGRPYVYRGSDIPTLLGSDCIFARKFDMKVDPKAVAAIRRELLAVKGSPKRGGPIATRST